MIRPGIFVLLGFRNLPTYAITDSGGSILQYAQAIENASEVQSPRRRKPLPFYPGKAV